MFVSGTGQAICLVLIFTKVASTVQMFFFVICVDCFFGLVVTSLKETLLVEQSRKDIVNGLGDIQTIVSVFQACGSMIGCVIGAYLIDTQ